MNAFDFQNTEDNESPSYRGYSSEPSWGALSDVVSPFSQVTPPIEEGVVGATATDERVAQLFTCFGARQNTSDIYRLLLSAELSKAFNESLAGSEIPVERLWHGLKPDFQDLPNEQWSLLDVPKVFRASKALVHVYVSSQLHWSKGATASPTRKGLSDSALETEFSRTIISLLVTIAQEFRGEVSVELCLTEDGRWNSDLQLRVCERFFVVPDLCERFLSLLYGDLRDFLVAGGTIAGDWGRFFCNPEEDLCAELAPVQIRNDATFKKARRVE